MIEHKIKLLMYKIYLKQYTYVETATSGIEALQYLENNIFLRKEIKKSK